ncbi:hypothetical protein FOJ82_00525 [Tessaracoccus rhinocerotis]|uniref:Uncharacterized protein n=1 Tax=Tessaracoccus rhinocerotis TaxID=1689449 RepID=A0A553K425_9ACTN|nr:hypothetical protein [Tessaracoccus rhinocerotis]TRY19436.1 hypothetical protein FOJ82_00525 [Tessaracoccus rhinocerotis]
MYDVQSAVDKYQSLPKLDDLSCAGTQTVVFTLLLEYDDGREARVDGDLGACGMIGDGHTLSDEGGLFLEHVLGLWEAQRVAGYTYPEEEVGECATASLIRAAATEAVRGVWCSRDMAVETRGGGGSWLQGSPIPADVLHEISEEIGTATDPAPSDWNTEAFIMLEDQYGDAVALEWLGSRGYAFNDGGGRTAFVPSAELAAALTRLRQS